MACNICKFVYPDAKECTDVCKNTDVLIAKWAKAKAILRENNSTLLCSKLSGAYKRRAKPIRLRENGGKSAKDLIEQSNLIRQYGISNKLT